MASGSGVVFSAWRRACMRALACVLLVGLSYTAHAAEHRFQLLLDTDNQSATGCAIPTAHGTVNGIEQVWTTVVATSTSGANVVRIEQQTCSGGVLGAPVVHDASSWPAGIGHGTSGVAALETFIPLALLPPQTTLKVVAASTNATGGQDSTSAFLVSLAPPNPPSPQGEVREIPLSPWLVLALTVVLATVGARWLRRHPEHGTLVVCVVLIAASGLVWAATVTLDGNVGDWNGVAPDTTNAPGSGPVDANIVAVFHQSDATNLYMRIDADVRADSAANQAPLVSAGADQTVTLPAGASLAGSASDDGVPNPPGALTITWSTISGPGTVGFGNASAAATTATFSQPGTYVLRLTANDGALGSSDDVQITVNPAGGGNAAPQAKNDSSATTGGAATQIDVLANDSDPDGNTLTVSSFGQGAHGSVSCTSAGLCTYTPNSGFSGTDSFTYTVSDGHGGTANAIATITITTFDTTVTPPTLKKGTANIVGKSSAFLYTGTNPVQTGVSPGTISETRSAVLRGKVTSAGGAVLPNVTVTILGHPEFGQTQTRSNGVYDLVVNGGGPLTLEFNASGFLPAQRQVDVPWQAYVPVPRVALVPLDTHVTAMTANSSNAQTHQSGRTIDGDGSRAIIVVVPAGTTATMQFANGTTQPLAAMHVRATEYTVGADGPQSMPARLPPLSGYTYCVELSVDEAIAAGAEHVTFSQPVVTYVENFLNFPVGTNVPVGFYERSTGLWVPSSNGRVVKIVSVTNGLADVDSDGDNAADTELALSDDERRTLAQSYAVGQTLWRVAMTHFSSVDSNWPFSTPNDAVAPGDNGAGPDQDQPQQNPHCNSGSTIQCENRVLGESVPIVGTPYLLTYRSDRMPGLIASRGINLSGSSVPASLQSISMHVAVGGREFDQTFPAVPNQRTTFVWDRKDAFGRTLIGGQTLNVRIDYNYPTQYQDPGPQPSAFNSVGVSLGVGQGRTQLNVSQSFTTTIGEGLTDARTLGLGGWEFNVHHVYDPNARVAYLGNGAYRRAGSLARSVSVASLTGQSQLFDIAVAPDGSQFVALPHGDQILRIAPNGAQTVYAGTGVEGFNGDGIQATLAELGDPTGIAFGADGSLYIAEESNFRVRKVSPSGIISTIAGTGVAGFSGDGGPATSAQLSFAERIAVGPDGTVYVLDGQRVRRINNDGIIQTIAGNGTFGGAGDGGPATQASVNPSSISVAADGSVFIADFGNHRVRKVGPDGIINTVIDYSTTGGRPVSVRPATDGTLLIGVQFDTAQLPQIDLLHVDGTVVTIAGGGTSALVTGTPATQVAIPALRAVALAPDGTLYFVQGDASSNVVRVSPALPGFDGSGYFIASANGAEVYVFDDEGRHVRTLNALTGASLFEFGYDASGLLNQITEKTGGIDNVTTIQHDANGNPVSITGPFGQVTSLAIDGNGFLTSIADPLGHAFTMVSDAGGLLSSFTDPRGKSSTFAFDPDGHLAQDTDAVGGSQTFVHGNSGNDSTVTRTTKLNRTTTYLTRLLAGNTERRIVTEADGTSSQNDEAIDAGTRHATSTDGTVIDGVLGPDPRFGMSSPFMKSTSVSAPSGLTRTTTSALTVALSDPADPFSLTSLTESFTANGQTTHNTYTAATGTLTSTSPEGRTVTTVTDGLGRLVAGQTSGFAATAITYDARGRINALSQGARTLQYTYGPDGYAQSITDPLGRVTQLSYDAAGRVTNRSVSGAGTTSFAFDEAGNLTSITPPGGATYSFTYSDRGELVDIIPPAVSGTGPTHYAYNLDREPTTITRPDGLAVTLGYDAAGRFVSRSFTVNGAPDGQDTLDYDNAGRLHSIDARGGETTTYAYDGQLMTGKTWSGVVSGSVTQAFDDRFRRASESVNGGNTVTYAYDNDDLVVGAGAVAISRDAQNGLVTTVALGNASTSFVYDTFGAPTHVTSTASASTVLDNDVVRDVAGRVTQKTETIGGVTDTWTYTYAPAGDLVGVKRNGADVEQYGYDANGNRTSATVNGTSVVASYDAQDRLLQYGATQFTFNAAGDLASRTVGGQVTTYRYDAMGNLLSATLPSGTVIDYVVDGNNQRVGRKVNGALVQGLLYRGTQIAAELDGADALVSRFVYAGAGVPVAMMKGGATFRILTDVAGNVRAVVNSATGAIAQRLDYDSFGNVTLDTNPGFQPFGFAGGLYDRDTGLVRFGARDYDPSTGRWTAKDPAGFAAGDKNLYRYALNDPVNERDASGLDGFDTLVGFGEEINRDVQMSNPFVFLQVTIDAGVRWTAVKLGVDPNSQVFFGVPPPGYDHVPSLYEQMFRPPTTADRSSADYTKGELIGECVMAATALVDVGAGLAEGAGRLMGKIDSWTAGRAADELAQQVADRAAARAARAAAPEAKGPGLYWIRPEGGGAGTNAAGKAAGGFFR